MLHVVRQIRPAIWQIEFRLPASTNCWLVQEDDGLTLIDAAHTWSCTHILKAVGHIKHPLRRIVITHAHPDHAGAAAELAAKTNAVVMAHDKDIPYLTGSTCLANERGFFPTRVVLNTALALRALSNPPIERIEPLEEGTKIGSLSVLHTPGHTPGSISLWLDRDRAIFCGDNIIRVFNSLRPGMPWFTLDLSVQRESLRRYLQLDARLMLSGHGPAYSGDVTGALKWLKTGSPESLRS